MYKYSISEEAGLPDIDTLGDDSQSILHQHQTAGNEQQKFMFAISGFVGPWRTLLRKKGLKLGGEYRTEWSNDCTHLIAATPTTPKANMAKISDGMIVTNHIHVCFFVSFFRYFPFVERLSQSMHELV